MREALFIRAYLGEARGNGAKAARLAGYSPTYANREAARVLKRPRVREAIDRALKEQARREGIDKATLVGHLAGILHEDRPFERLKAIELLARLLGYFAPSRSIRETISHPGEAPSYRELARTLQEHGAAFSAEQLESIARRCEEEAVALQQCRDILAGLLRKRGTHWRRRRREENRLAAMFQPNGGQKR